MTPLYQRTKVLASFEHHGLTFEVRKARNSAGLLVHSTCFDLTFKGVPTRSGWAWQKNAADAAAYFKEKIERKFDRPKGFREIVAEATGLPLEEVTPKAAA